MDRCHLECIQDFSLNDEKVIITIPNNRDHYEGVGEFTSNDACMADEKPYSYVYDYIVRTELAVHMDQSWLTEAHGVATKKAKKDGRELYEDVEFTKDVLTDLERETVFKYTKLRKEYVYEFFCKRTLDEAKFPKIVQKSYGHFPEMFQPVMVTQKMMSEMYTDVGLHATLRFAFHSHRNTYESLFGTFENALVGAPFIENTFSKLPVGVHKNVGGGIPVRSMRRVISPKVASVAAFFAFACYDETSLNRAYALLQKNMDCGDKIKDEETLFKDNLVLLFGKPRGNYLFHQTIMEDGVGFVTNVVNVLNRFGLCLFGSAEYSPNDGEHNLLGRLNSLLFRTMCSDIVEIYVSHGGYPRCRRSIFEYHPDLSKLKKLYLDVGKGNTFDDGKLQPVPLLLEYIMKLIDDGHVLVRTTHYFRKNPFALFPFEDKVTRGKKRTEQPRPKTNKIRYLYHCFGLKEIGLEDGLEHEVWMMLPELVNVILFRMKCPWDSVPFSHSGNKVNLGQVITLWPSPNMYIEISNPLHLWGNEPITSLKGKGDDRGVGGANA
jgi:hypothetical protein